MTDTFQRFRRLHQALGDIINDAMKAQAQIPAAYTAASVTLPDGYPTGHGEPVSGGDVSNPTLGVIVAREGALDVRYDRRTDDYIRTGLTACDTSALVARRALDEIRIELGDFIGKEQATDRTIGLQPGAGHCRACRTWVPGGTDRITTGYCTRCYKRWQRADKPDHTAFIRATQLDLGLIGPTDKTIITDEPDQG